MFYQNDSRMAFNERQKQAIGLSIEEFTKKHEWLKKHWLAWIERGDSEEGRLMGSVIVSNPIAINLSIIADNLSYFKENHQKYYQNSLNRALRLACLCGSQRIVEFLLEELKANLKNKEYDFVLVYACTSLNESWVLQLAADMSKMKMDMPDEVYLFCNDIARLDKIKSLFNEGSSLKTTIPI